MLGIVLILLSILLISGHLGFDTFDTPNYVISQFNGHPITLIQILIFLVVIWAVSLLPKLIREIVLLLLVVWVLSLLGFISLIGVPDLFILAILLIIVFKLLIHD